MYEILDNYKGSIWYTMFSVLDMFKDRLVDIDEPIWHLTQKGLWISYVS